MSRPLSQGERVVDGWVNVIGLAAGIPKSGFIMKSSLVYSGALVAMLGCSALYNASCDSPHRGLFRRLDHLRSS